MKSFDRLISALRRLPGIGPKQAERLALYLYRASASETEAFISALREAKERVRACSICCNYSESAVCPLCADPGRDRRLLCVVEEPADVSAVERTRGYRGCYHVLHGALSPLDGIGPEMLRLKELAARLEGTPREVEEVILAMDHDTEGDATALYLGEILKPLGLKVTRIATGVPMGGDLDYIDERTLSCALSGRREF